MRFTHTLKKERCLIRIYDVVKKKKRKVRAASQVQSPLHFNQQIDQAYCTFNIRTLIPRSSRYFADLQKFGRVAASKMSLESIVVDSGVERPDYHLYSQERLESVRDAESFFVRGYRLRRGIGVGLDDVHGWEMIVQAALSGHPVALAFCLLEGKQIEKNSYQAVHLLTESAQRGHPIGDFTLTTLCSLLSALCSLLSALCSLLSALCSLRVQFSFLSAQNSLGVCFQKADGAPRDMRQAIMWYTRACEQRFSQALYNLGVCHE